MFAHLRLVSRKDGKRSHSRRIFIVDIENIAGGVLRANRAAQWAKRVIEERFGVQSGDHVVIGTSPDGFIYVKSAWPGARVIPNRGPNGADLVLIDVLDQEDLESRFDEVVLVSGDRIFASSISRLGGLGVRVTVAAWSTSISPSLRLPAHDVVHLDNISSHIDLKEIA